MKEEGDKHKQRGREREGGDRTREGDFDRDANHKFNSWNDNKCD